MKTHSTRQSAEGRAKLFIFPIVVALLLGSALIVIESVDRTANADNNSQNGGNNNQRNNNNDDNNHQGLAEANALQLIQQDHDGRFKTLLDVVNRYNVHFNLGLTDGEKQDLVEHLKSLTGQ